MVTHHLIGIGGAGMSVVAELLAARGHAVQGSDAKRSEVLARLEQQGIRTFVGHDASHVGPGMVVVVSTAIRLDNPELVRARDLSLEVIHRSEALARAAAGMDFVAVAGAHGKTTTSAMVAVALREAGLDPSWAIGGTVVGVGSGAHLGAGNVFVAEADESDRSFLNYTPRIAVVTNVEPDHLDHYGSEAAFIAAFHDFLGRIVAGGLLVACRDDAGAAGLLDVARSRGIRCVSYGTTAPDAADALVVDGDGVVRGGERHPLVLRVGGDHNRLNAAAAFAVGLELGVAPDVMGTALGAFLGTGRRFEDRGALRGIRVVDDYAHHPTEVAATLATARAAAGGGRVLVLFQPHLFSRTRQFADRFAAALDLADDVVVTAIYAAREDPEPGVTSELITRAMRRGRYVADRHQAAREVAGHARPGDIVLTMGAGDVTDLADEILAAL
ncbi:MAG: UDP-N-acetylmuramate--L-alanine ligase [Actinobacteria bacterium]|nr:UDP-N-acetylmuramate--L-alanine ligase [Actinomycetota bacterium]